MKLSLHFIFGLLAVMFLTVFLSWSYFQPAVQSPVQAVEDLGQFEPQGGGFGEAKCDRIIPIGKPLEDTVNLMVAVLSEQQNAGGYVKSASGNLQNIFALLNKDNEFVCDFTKCLPVAVDFGPEFALELDLLIKKITLGGHAPIPANKDCAGSPCPDLGDEKAGPIGALAGWLAAIEESRNRVKTIFEEPTVTVYEDIAQLVPADPNNLSKGYVSDLGQKITQQEAIRRMATKAAVMVKECSLSELEKKMVLSGRLGDKYPMRCKDAIEAGQYWPMPWSEVCKAECDDGQGSEPCIKCLQKKTPDLKKASILGRLNYKIYNACGEKCQDQESGDWGLNSACLECLCSEAVVTAIDVTGQGNDTIEVRQMSDEACLAFLCGGSSHNWTCCHEAPIEFLGDESPYGGPPISYSPTPVEYTGGDATPGPTAGTFKVTQYIPPAHCEGKCVATAHWRKGMAKGYGDLGVYFGIIAVDADIIPFGSRVKVLSLWDDNGSDAPGTALGSFMVDGEDVVGKVFYACDRINQTGYWIDMWLPSADLGWGRKWASLEVVYDPNDNPCEKLREQFYKDGKLCKKTCPVPGW